MLTHILTSPAPAPSDIYEKSNSIAFSIGSFDIAWYAIFIMIGFAVAIFFVCMKLWKYYKISIEPFYWFIIVAVPTAIVCARTWSCVIGDTPWSDWINFRNGGLAIEGGVMGAVILGFIWFPLWFNRPKYKVDVTLSKDKKVILAPSTLLMFDAIMPAVLIAQAIGRWGNYFNQEVYGPVVTNEGLTWWLHDNLPWMYVNGQWREPFFFWESLMNIFGFLLLYFVVELIPKKKAGTLGFTYLIWYGILRLSMEPFREEQFRHVASIVTSVIWIVIGVIGIIVNQLFCEKWRKYHIWKAFTSEIKAYYMITTQKFKTKQLENAQKKVKKNKKQLTTAQVTKKFSDLTKEISESKEKTENILTEIKTKRKLYVRKPEEYYYYFYR